MFPEYIEKRKERVSKLYKYKQTEPSDQDQANTVGDHENGTRAGLSGGPCVDDRESALEETDFPTSSRRM